MSVSKLKELHDDAQAMIKDTRRMLEEAKAMMAKLNQLLDKGDNKHE